MRTASLNVARELLDLAASTTVTARLQTPNRVTSRRAYALVNLASLVPDVNIQSTPVHAASLDHRVVKLVIATTWHVTEVVLIASVRLASPEASATKRYVSS